MEKIPTAEEVLNRYDSFEHYEDTVFTEKSATAAMISFAELHVTAALEAAAEKAKAKETPSDYGTGEIWVDKDSILKAYPLENIK